MMLKKMVVIESVFERRPDVPKILLILILVSVLTEPGYASHEVLFEDLDSSMWIPTS